MENQNEIENFLAHYGVLGMKWGVTKEVRIKNRLVKRETQAKKFDSKAAIFQTRINELRSIKTRNPYRQHAINDAVDIVTKDRNTAIKDASAKRQGKLTSEQKKVIVGASIVAGLIATKIAYDGTQSGEFRRIAEKGKAFLQGKKFDFAKKASLTDATLDANQILQSVVKQVNPDYGDIGTKMNCRRATFAYEMRRRGYDVMATRTTNAYGQHGAGLLNAITPGEKFKNTSIPGVMTRAMYETAIKGTGKATPLLDINSGVAAGARNKVFGGGTPINIFDALKQEANGSRGELGVMWAGGGGHSMAYEIVKGAPVIFDNQSGKMYESAEALEKMGDIASSGYTRLDNIPLNTDYLMRWVRDATK